MSHLRLFDEPGPRWFTIAANRPFVTDLAQGLFEALAHLGPETLSQTLVLTPTRRGARSLTDAFLKVTERRPLLPPQIRPLGDLDEGEAPFEPGDLVVDLPTAISPLRRRFELIALVKAHEKTLERELNVSSALDLADALGGFLDSLQIEEITVGDGLSNLVSAELAEHWQMSQVFLDLALEAWPKRLAELGLMDISARRVALLTALAEKWAETPPPGFLVAAGSTGTAPATRRLLGVIAKAPLGAVVLPGLDLNLDLQAWTGIHGEDGEQHPQGAMKRLLDSVGLDRSQVRPWPVGSRGTAAGHWRRQVINEALRPPKATADWLKAIEDLKAEGEKDGVDPFAEGLKGLSLVTARTEDQAATAAALLLREVLETEGKTGALVCPDQALSRRIATKLTRWGIEVDSSAGIALSGTPAGRLAGLVAEAVVDSLNPIRILAILKHPLVSLNREPEARQLLLADLEREALRGPRPRNLAAMLGKLSKYADAQDLLSDYQAAMDRAILAADGAPGEAARGLAEALEALARTASGDTGKLWAGPGGDALSKLLATLIDDSQGLPEATPRAFAELLKTLLAKEPVRTGGGTHPRLHILGAIEARLTRADRLIIAGLEEGVWPQAAPVDPFLSRPMRKALGLPSPERRVGLAAHDFAQAACAEEVILLHCERRNGSPTLKSRWLWRLETLVKGAGSSLTPHPDLKAWAETLDAAGPYAPAKRPAPAPPQADRPRELAVTRIETLTRDPYAIWARDILKLYPMDRPDESVDVRARGTAIHAAFERFAKTYPDALPDQSSQIFLGYYLEALAEAGMPEDAMVREKALGAQIGVWVAEFEAERRADGRKLIVEPKGSHTFNLPGGAFTVTARADRIEIDPAGMGHILDYKTGSPPSPTLVKAGYAPQLTLTAAILAHGGFKDLGPHLSSELAYIKITGRKPAGSVIRAGGEKDLDFPQMAESALEGLGRLIMRYDDPARPYLSRTNPPLGKSYPGDYDHLARVFEWSSQEEEVEET